jgi:hypothetical protein
MWCLKPVILATWEAEIWQIIIQSQPVQKVPETPSQPMAGCGVVCLSSQLPREAQAGWPRYKAWIYLKEIKVRVCDWGTAYTQKT